MMNVYGIHRSNWAHSEGCPIVLSDSRQTLRVHSCYLCSRVRDFVSLPPPAFDSKEFLVFEMGSPASILKYFFRFHDVLMLAPCGARTADAQVETRVALVAACRRRVPGAKLIAALFFAKMFPSKMRLV